jgi:hypothetical protein
MRPRNGQSACADAEQRFAECCIATTGTLIAQ